MSKKSSLPLVSRAFLSMATPGFVSATALGLLSLTDAPGISHALHDFAGHVFHIHPFLHALVAVVLGAAIVMQGADVLDDLDKCLWLPSLEFLAHSFSIACGAMIPLALASHDLPGRGLCGRTVAVLAVLFWFLLMALLATVGVLIVKRRIAFAEEQTRSKVEGTEGTVQKDAGTEATKANATIASATAKSDIPAHKATPSEIKVFLVVFVGSCLLAIYAAKQNESTDVLVDRIGGTIGAGVCRL